MLLTSAAVQNQPIVSIASLSEGYGSTVENGLRRSGFFGNTARGDRVFLKPNLTFPTYRPGVMTSMECLSAVTEILIDHGYRVIIGEGDSGGYNRFSIDEVFEQVGINTLAKRTGATTVNVSFTEPTLMPVKAGWRNLSVPVPKMMLEEIDAFITLPVPKIHMNTLVSMSIKNQWGCIQDPSERLKLHPYFAEVMYEFNRRLPRAHSIIDGRYGLNRTGPMKGDVVELDWLMVSNDLVAADRVCLKLMQLEESRVAYLKHFQRQKWWTDFSNISLPADWESFRREKFYLERKWTDLPGLACFNNAFLAWLGYHSPLAGFAHWLLYKFREPFYDYSTEASKVRKNGGQK